MTAKNIDLDKLEWSKPEDFSNRTREEFVQRAQGCWVKRVPWKPDEHLIFTDVAIDPNRASRVYVLQTDDYIEDYLYKDTWQFAKIPQEEAEEPKETNQPNPFPSDDVEKEEPEFITSETDAGFRKVMEAACLHPETIETQSKGMGQSIHWVDAGEHSKPENIAMWVFKGVRYLIIYINDTSAHLVKKNVKSGISGVWLIESIQKSWKYIDTVDLSALDGGES